MTPSGPSAARGSVQDGDKGYALVAVVITMVGLTLFAFLAMSVAVRAAVPSRSAGDAVTATAAAQAGVDDYLARLALNPTYYALGGTGDDAANLAFVRKRDGSAYPGAARDALGVAVPGSGARAFFRYRLLTSPAETSQGGTIRLQVTGTTPAAGSRPARSQTLTATLRQPGFLDYLYFTDREGQDPDLFSWGYPTARVDGSGSRWSGSDQVTFVADKGAVAEVCGSRWFEGRGAPQYTSSPTRRFWEVRSNGSYVQSTDYGRSVTFDASTCNQSDLIFAGSDVIDGPLHSNDALNLPGPTTFNSPKTETSWPDGSTPGPGAKRWRGGGTPSRYPPVYAAPIPLPESNDQLRARAAVNGTGCTYQGETRVKFVNGQVWIHSPSTPQSQTQSGCMPGDPSQPRQLAFVPAVIYVTGTTASCTTGRVGYPQATEDTSGTTTKYDCSFGNAFVEGQVSGQTTIGAERDIVVTGDVTYVGGATGTDVLGLVANQYVWVYQPFSTNSSGAHARLPGGAGDRRIDAAILALQHSFIHQNPSWRSGSTNRGTLTVNGAIAQKYRGPMGNASPAGFLKNYVYDERLRYLPPPFFLTPLASPWSVARMTDG